MKASAIPGSSGTVVERPSVLQAFLISFSQGWMRRSLHGPGAHHPVPDRDLSMSGGLRGIDPGILAATLAGSSVQRMMARDAAMALNALSKHAITTRATRALKSSAPLG